MRGIHPFVPVDPRQLDITAVERSDVAEDTILRSPVHERFGAVETMKAVGISLLNC
jgi:hypothetical protein